MICSTVDDAPTFGGLEQTELQIVRRELEAVQVASHVAVGLRDHHDRRMAPLLLLGVVLVFEAGRGGDGGDRGLVADEEVPALAVVTARRAVLGEDRRALVRGLLERLFGVDADGDDVELLADRPADAA